MIVDLVHDFADVLEAMPEGHPRRRILKLLDEAIRQGASTMQRHFAATTAVGEISAAFLLGNLCAVLA